MNCRFKRFTFNGSVLSWRMKGGKYRRMRRGLRPGGRRRLSWQRINGGDRQGRNSSNPYFISWVSSKNPSKIFTFRLSTYRPSSGVLHQGCTISRALFYCAWKAAVRYQSRAYGNSRQSAKKRKTVKVFPTASHNDMF